MKQIQLEQIDINKHSHVQNEARLEQQHNAIMKAIKDGTIAVNMIK
jgi:hypothetical protein